ncbi:MAG: sigma-70 family RNA polymerase sigma factor [Pyrinomonadaceae bacterium]|nr:sigma-70 family RNA polymerase sigma factor [Phycisphaerales bacterium]
MPEFSRSTTTTLLLESLHDPLNQEAWSALDHRMRPIIHGVALRLGVSTEDAADVAQETMTNFLRSYRSGQYVRGKGRLRDWMCGIARNRVMDLHRSRSRRREAAVDVGDIARIEESGVRQLWNEEERKTILEQSMQELREKSRMSERTIRAFEMVLLGVPDREVADQCGMTVPEVYVAKHRVATKLRQIVAELTAAYDQEG